MYKFIKRLLDIIISIIGIIFLIPIIIIVKLHYILNGDFKSIFYLQDRIGKNGKLFKIIKFRTMKDGASELLNEILKDDNLNNQFKNYKKIKNDPRILPYCKWLRHFSIDEFPQFLNIFIGNMSVVGNRPYLPNEKKDMGKYYKNIIKTKPGLTGIWQVSGRTSIPFNQRCIMESKYSNEMNVTLDIKIFFKTFVAIFKSNGED